MDLSPENRPQQVYQLTSLHSHVFLSCIPQHRIVLISPLLENCLSRNLLFSCVLSDCDPALPPPLSLVTDTNEAKKTGSGRRLQVCEACESSGGQVGDCDGDYGRNLWDLVAMTGVWCAMRLWVRRSTRAGLARLCMAIAYAAERSWRMQVEKQRWGCISCKAPLYRSRSPLAHRTRHAHKPMLDPLPGTCEPFAQAQDLEPCYPRYLDALAYLTSQHQGPSLSGLSPQRCRCSFTSQAVRVTVHSRTSAFYYLYTQSQA